MRLEEPKFRCAESKNFYHSKGEFKKHDYGVGLHEVGVPASRVEREVGDLLAEVNGYIGPWTLMAAAYLHARFEHLHPFADGNGRVGRTLVNYYLMQ